MSGTQADLLKRSTQALTAEARLATAQAKAQAAQYRVDAAAEQAKAAATRSVIAGEKAATAVIGTNTAASRQAAAAARAAAAGSAARASSARADSAAIGVEAAQSRAVAAGFNAEAAQARAAAAASRALVAEARANAVAMSSQVSAGAAVVSTFGAIRTAAMSIGTALRAAGGGIGNIITGFGALGAAGFNGARRAGQAITTFIVTAANAGVRAVGRLAGSFRTLGTSSIGVLRGVGTAFGILTTAFGIFAVGQAVKFQEAMATINTVMQLSVGDTDKLGRSIRNLAVDAGLPISDLTSAMYELASAGVAIGDEFVKAAGGPAKALIQQTMVLAATAHLAVGGLATMTESTKLMSFALNAFGLNTAVVSNKVANAAGLMGGSIGQVATQISDYFAKSVEIGVVKASEIASTFATVAATAKYAGIGLDEIAAAYAQQTRRGVSAAKVANSMNRALQDLIQPSKTLKALQGKTGINFLELAGREGLGVALEKMRTEADRLGISYRDLFKRQEGFRFAVNSTGKDYQDYLSTLKQVRAASSDTATINGKLVTGTAAIQTAIRSDTVVRNIIRLQESFKSLGITIGYWFLAPLNEVIKAITRVVTFTDRWLDSLDNAGKNIARQAAGLIALVGSILALGAGLQGFLLISSKIAPMFGATATGARALQVGIRALALPLALVVGFIGGLAFAIQNNIAGMGKYIDTLTMMKDTVGNALAILTSFGHLLSETLKALSAGKDVGPYFASGLHAIGIELGLLGPMFAASVSFIVAQFFALAGNVITVLSNVAPTVAEWALSVVGTIINGLLGLAPAMLRWASSVAATVGPALVQLGRNLFAWVGDVARSIGPTLAALLSLFVDWAASVASSVLPRLGRFGGEVVAWLGGMIQSIGPGVLQLTAAFVGWVADVARGVIAGLLQLGRDIVGWLRGLAAQIAPGLAYLAGYLVGWIAQAAPKAVAALGDFFSQVIRIIEGAVPTIAAAALALGAVFVDWVGSIIPTVVARVGDLLAAIVKWVTDNAPDILRGLGQWAIAMSNWFATEALPAIANGLVRFVDGVVAWIQQDQVVRRVTTALVSLAGAVLAGVAFLAAKVLPEVAVQIISGLGDALVNNLPLIIGAATVIAATLVGSLVDAIIQDPLAFAKGILALVTASVVISAIASAGTAAGALYSRFLVLGNAIATAVGSAFDGLASAIGSRIVAAGLAQGGILGWAISAGVQAVAWIQAMWAALLTKMLPGAFATGLAEGEAMGAGMAAGSAGAGEIVGASLGAGIASSAAAVIISSLPLLIAAMPALTTPQIANPMNGEDTMFGPRGPLNFAANWYDQQFGTNYGGRNNPNTDPHANVNPNQYSVPIGPPITPTDPLEVYKKWADGIRAAQMGSPLDWGPAFTGIPSATDTAIADAKTKIKQGFADIRTEVTNGTNSLTNQTTFDPIVSDKTRIGNLTTQLKSVDAALAKAKRLHDTTSVLKLSAQQTALKGQIADLKWASTHTSEILANTQATTTSIGALIDKEKTDFATKNGALQTAITQAETAARVLQSMGVIPGGTVPPPPVVPPPTTPTAPTAYEGIRNALGDAIGSTVPLPGPAVGGPPAETIPNVIGVYKGLRSNIGTVVSTPVTPPSTAPVTGFVSQINQQLNGIPIAGATAANQATANITAGLGGTAPVSAATTLAGRIATALTTASLFVGGATLIQTWIQGMLSKIPAVTDAARALAHEVFSQTHGASPPEKGPLSRIDEGGAGVIRAWVGGLLSQIPLVTGASMQLASAALPNTGLSQAFLGQRQSFMVPSDAAVAGRLTGKSDTAESERILRQMLAALGLNNELTAASVSDRPRAVDKVGVKGVIATAKAASGGRI